MINNDEPEYSLSGYTKIEISQSGKSAILSKKPLIQLTYKGGSSSPLGFTKG